MGGGVLSEEFRAGSLLAGYRLEERIGAGGMAVVYRARDEVLGRLVAVKVLASALAADEEFRARFLRESRAVAAVDEPHIVPVYGAGDVGGLLYIATRFVAGGDLSRLQAAAGGPLRPAVRLTWSPRWPTRSTRRTPSGSCTGT
jgi:serine/threonine-protein kinase